VDESYFHEIRQPLDDALDAIPGGRLFWRTEDEERAELHRRW
jgi:hypothetical protein